MGDYDSKFELGNLIGLIRMLKMLFKDKDVYEIWHCLFIAFNNGKSFDQETLRTNLLTKYMVWPGTLKKSLSFNNSR